MSVSSWTTPATPTLETVDAGLLLVEQMRHVIRDAVDEHVVGATERHPVGSGSSLAWSPFASRER